MRPKCARTVGAAVVLFIAASNAAAQPRPLPPDTTDGIGAGNVRLQVGTDYARDARFTLSGLEGQLWRVALISLDAGLSNVADLELSGGLRDHLAITSRTPAVLSNLLQLSNPDSTGAFDDILIGTKVSIIREQASTPGIAVRVLTRLPNAKHPSGLGQDTTDFYASAIVAHTLASTHVVGTAGIGVLGDPLQGNRRVPSFLYGLAARRSVAQGIEAVAGFDGRTGPVEPGLESRAIARLGVARTRGAASLEADLTFGLTNRDGNIGFAVNTAFTFHGFNP